MEVSQITLILSALFTFFFVIIALHTGKLFNKKLDMVWDGRIWLFQYYMGLLIRCWSPRTLEIAP